MGLVSFAARSQSRLGIMVRTAIETIVVYLRDELIEPIMGHAGRPYLHYMLTLFFFILFCNLAGLIPGSATATGNVAVTGALSLCTLGLIIIGGVKAQGGILKFLRHFIPLGPDSGMVMIMTLGPLLFVLEIAGLIVKCVALTIRLFANMIAGHIVSLGFLALIFILGTTSQAVGLAVAPVSVGMVVFVYLIELLVALLQAFIFTLLTAVFVGTFLHAEH